MLKFVITFSFLLVSLINYSQVNSKPPDWIYELAEGYGLIPVSNDEVPFLSENSYGFGNLNLQGFIEYTEKKFILFLAKNNKTSEFFYVFATNDYLRTDKYIVEDVFVANHFLGLHYLQGKLRGDFKLSEFFSVKNINKRGPKGLSVESSWIEPIIIPYKPPITLIYINNEWFMHSLGDW